MTLDPVLINLLSPDEVVQHNTCTCGHGAIFCPLGDPAMHHCFNCGSAEVFNKLKAEMAVKIRKLKQTQIEKEKHDETDN